MPNKLEARLAKIEAHRAGPAAYFVELPDDAWEHDDEHLKRVMEEAIREHRARTGYQGAVLVGPPECKTGEEWMELVRRRAENG
ncbi:hypothetical protein EAH89_28270 [Roseomonas nepalensis]|uniref:Uncharacterized protein n=1 Tax=Muricoccus nepalensis TaxID=1854500 RepID=A0A502EW30_9PROT|nr:hypothetical protein EAH89_28270 [Roseomonas nepalensis]